jgi:DNA-binding transcriptional ArsR family regulator
MRYPPRGVAELWVTRKMTPSTALVGVFGTTRARLLTELANPASTTDLARRVGLTPGGASQHLTAMKAAGLVSAHRVGRHVLYARTAVAEELLRT